MFLLCQSQFVFAQQIIGNVYDYCTSPKRAVQTATGNWVFGLTDKNTPQRINGTYSDNGCLAKLKNLLQDSNNIFISVDMYAFRSYVLLQELLNARENGVNVVVTVDSGQQEQQAAFAQERGYQPILNILTSHQIITFSVTGKAGGVSHNKTLFVVQRVPENTSTYRYIYVTGSYNYTDNAETQNRENLVFITSPILSIEALNDLYTVVTDVGDVETGARNLLGQYLIAQQQSGAANRTAALPPAMNQLLTEEGYATQYSSSSQTNLDVTTFPNSAQTQMQNNITALMNTAYNMTSSGSTNEVPIPGQPVAIGTVDFRQCIYTD